MKITKLSLEQFRNMENTSFCPGEGVNVIYGDNAQGKTNLIEAIYLFTGLKSFRSSRDAQLIMQGRDFSKLNMEFEMCRRDSLFVVFFFVFSIFLLQLFQFRLHSCHAQRRLLLLNCKREQKQFC